MEYVILVIDYATKDSAIMRVSDEVYKYMNAIPNMEVIVKKKISLAEAFC